MCQVLCFGTWGIQNYCSALKKSVVQWGREARETELETEKKSQITEVKNCLFTALQATLFVRHPESGKLLVNFDPKILEVVRETKCMIKMKLDVPEQAKRLLKLESKLKADKLHLQVR